MDTVSSMVKQADALQALEFKVMEAEEKLKNLQAQYFAASKAAAELFAMNGVTELTTSTGMKYKVQTVTQCSIAKDAKPFIAKWLRKHDAGHLVNEQCIVPASQKEALEENHIIYESNVDMNTNSVKSYLLGALGQKESPATITVDDLPKGLSWFQYETVSRVKK